jgi:hypothetical protein
MFASWSEENRVAFVSRQRFSDRFTIRHQLGCTAEAWAFADINKGMLPVNQAGGKALKT